MILDSSMLAKQLTRHDDLHDSIIENVSISCGTGIVVDEAIVRLHPKPNKNVPLGTRITVRFRNLSEFRVWHPESFYFQIFESHAEFIEGKIWFDFMGAMQLPYLIRSVRADSELYFVADSIDWEEHIE